jgi:hypothetical protein
MVFLTRGMNLRIPAGGLEISLVDGTMSVKTVELAADLWYDWIDIAIRELRQAQDAHADLLAGADDADRGEAIEAEFRHSMVAIAAAAIGLDAFSSSVLVRLPRPTGEPVPDPAVDSRDTGGPPGGVQAGYITNILQRGYALTNEHARQLRQRLGLIFKFRAWSVHPPADFHAPVLHPDLQVGVEWGWWRSVRAMRRRSSAAPCRSSARCSIDHARTTPTLSNGPRR